jgi:hypothetical protein
MADRTSTAQPGRRPADRPVAGAPPVVDPPDAGALLAAIEVVASFVSTCEAARYDGDDAASLVAAFSRGKRLCAAGETLVAARAAECHAHLSLGHRSPADWLAAVTGASVGEAADVLKVGEALPSQPGVEAALRGGKLTPSRAKLVTGAVRRNPQKEAELVRGAEADTFRQLKDRCLRARAEGRRAEDADAAHAAVHAARRCRTWTDEEGAFRLDALLTPEAGASLLASLTRQSDRFFRASRTAGVHEPGEAYAADALVALVTGRGLLPASRSGVGPKGDNPKGDNPKGGDPKGGCRGGCCGPPEPRAMVQLRVDLAALRRGSVANGETCEIPGVGPVSVRTATELMGDAWVDLIVSDGVDVTTICRMGRSLPTPLRTALVERDRCCVAPGCDATRGLEIDHWQVDHAAGGPLSMDNLARLCRYHHYLRTHQGFVLAGGPGHWTFEPPEHPKARRTPGRRTPGRTSRAGPTKGPGVSSSGSTDPPMFTVEE